MKASIFNVAQKYRNKILLFNTYTTSMLEIEEEVYNDILCKNKFDQYQKETLALYEMGFLIPDNFDEAAHQQALRQTVIDSNSGKIANIIIAPTLECNAHCYYCFEKGHRRGTMSTETTDALIHHLKENWNGRKLGITWFGGEPLMAFDIIDYIIEGLNKNGIVFSSKITTNGSLLTEDKIQHIKEKWNVDKIQITIDAIGNEYNRIKNYTYIKDAFHTVVSNIKTALSYGLKLKIRINFDPEHKEKVLETMDYFNKNFPNENNLKIYFAPIDEDNDIVKNINSDFSDCYEHPYISLIKFGRKHNLYRGFPDMEDDDAEDDNDEKDFLKKLKIYPSVTNCYATCPSVYSIDPSGKIYKCHRVLGRPEYSSGDIFSGIQKNQEYRYFCNTNPAYKECGECQVLPICQGGCKINARIYKNKEACAPCKAIIKDLILLYKQDIDNLNKISLKGGESSEGV